MLPELEMDWLVEVTSESGATLEAPAASTMAINLRDRISDLEQSLAEERRALRESEARYAELKARFEELRQEQTSLNPPVAALELES
jgi:septal ring factor EnvC (AmiA/AmiB activator)